MTRIALLSLLFAATAMAGVRAQDVVAQRGALRLTAADVRALIAKADPAVRAQLQASPAALTEFVRDRLLRLSLLAEAKAKGWDQTPEIAARIAEARDQVIATTYIASLGVPDPAYPSDAELAAAYDANKASLMRPRQYQIAQIVVLAPAGQPDDAARKRIADLHQQALRPRADFAELARKNSQGRTSGDIAWTREDQLVPAIRDVVAGLAEGGISEPVRTADSWHILKLLGARPASPAPLAEVRDQLVQALRLQRTQQLARAALDESLRKDPIKINEIALQDLAR